MIKDIRASQVLDSRKKKTVKVILKTDKGTYTASAASGTSEGKYEAKALDIKTALKNFKTIKKKFIKRNEKDIDNIIEDIGIENIGAHLSISLSIAAFRAVSKNKVYSFLNSKAKTFPLPLGNVIGGGAHKGYTSEQEFLVFPKNAKTMKEAIETNLSIWKEFGEILKSHGIKAGNNYEGAWICKMNDIQALELLYAVANRENAGIGIDFAASEFYKDGFYHYKHLDRKLSPGEQLDFVLSLINTYDIKYVEDPFHEDDFKHLTELTKKTDCMIVGDDLFVTQAKRLQLGIEKKAGNGIIIKPDQAGTVSRVLETVKLAKKSNFSTVVSHRSGETMDDFISDLAVGIGSPLIKCGIFGKVRKAKHDRLMEIWKKTKSPRMAKIQA
ncbi:MAG: enolase [Candidatus Aenigmatarchaeota archaeon]